MKANGKCREESLLVVGCRRFSVLTDSLIRAEYQPLGHFEDRPTQAVLFRNFPEVKMEVERSGGNVIIRTENVTLTCDEKDTSLSGVRIQLGQKSWRLGDAPDNLGGTARTLDGIDGSCALGPGILSKDGWAIYDDSPSLLLREDGFVEPRNDAEEDVYLFAYGRRYREALRDFYRLTGKTPLIPKFALGNWWSRYHKYTQNSYQELMERFEREKIPFSVAVIDMDWHLVDVDKKYGNGWTGYTWNRELFPEPADFLSWLHRHGLKVTLNVHPADGVRAYEEPYRAMAEAMGADPDSGEPVPFAIHDARFLDAYMSCLHHPREEEGVDFWWIDWQQGEKTEMEGLDPLWMLNHFHYLDSKRRHARPMIFSRYAGPGGHRYPVGFSGDTVISWESLDFQPYFTATASNIGFSWWSHDVGGHMGGRRDDELSVRWVQFGVFSPIFRLHSTDNKYNGKEPWNYNREAGSVMKEFLLLRHRLIPYLYTMDLRASEESLPLVQPLYYEEPDRPEAYQVPNEYYFGDSMLVCPITHPVDPDSLTAGFDAWLPEGLWHDFFLPITYRGGEMKHLERSIESIPVLVRAGSILPLADLTVFTNRVDNPKAMDIHVFCGADGSFCLKEDACGNGEELAELSGDRAFTNMKLDWAQGSFTIDPVTGNAGTVPAIRSYRVCLRGIGRCPVAVYLDGFRADANILYEKARHAVVVSVEVDSREELTIQWKKPSILSPNQIEELAEPILNRAQISYDEKQEADRLLLDRSLSYEEKRIQLKTIVKEKALRSALLEALRETVRENGKKDKGEAL